MSSGDLFSKTNQTCSFEAKKFSEYPATLPKFNEAKNIQKMKFETLNENEAKSKMLKMFAENMLFGEKSLRSIGNDKFNHIQTRLEFLKKQKSTELALIGRLKTPLLKKTTCVDDFLKFRCQQRRSRTRFTAGEM